VVEMGKCILVPNFVVAKDIDKLDDALKNKLNEITTKAQSHSMIVLAFYIKDGSVLAVVAKSREQFKEFEVKLVNEELRQIDYFVANADKMFIDYNDVLKDANISTVRALWIRAKMTRYMEMAKKAILAFFYDSKDDELYVLTATEFFVELENITNILWDP
jgi:fructose 1,6-bisphosphatase